jgi:hypothetical protein
VQSLRWEEDIEGLSVSWGGKGEWRGGATGLRTEGRGLRDGRGDSGSRLEFWASTFDSPDRRPRPALSLVEGGHNAATEMIFDAAK